MDDVGKAIVLSSHVILFVLACSISIFLYSALTNNVNGVMLANNYSNQGDAIVDLELADATRNSPKSEVIMAILNLKAEFEKREYRCQSSS